MSVLAAVPVKFIPTTLIEDSNNLVSRDFVPHLQKMYPRKEGEEEVNITPVKPDESLPFFTKNVFDHDFQSPSYKRHIEDFNQGYINQKIGVQ